MDLSTVPSLRLLGTPGPREVPGQPHPLSPRGHGGRGLVSQLSAHLLPPTSTQRLGSTKPRGVSRVLGWLWPHSPSPPGPLGPAIPPVPGAAAAQTPGRKKNHSLIMTGKLSPCYQPQGPARHPWWPQGMAQGACMGSTAPGGAVGSSRN